MTAIQWTDETYLCYHALHDANSSRSTESRGATDRSVGTRLRAARSRRTEMVRALSALASTGRIRSGCESAGWVDSVLLARAAASGQGPLPAQARPREGPRLHTRAQWRQAPGETPSQLLRRGGLTARPEPFDLRGLRSRVASWRTPPRIRSLSRVRSGASRARSGGLFSLPSRAGA